jgi:hypothetical protein
MVEANKRRSRDEMEYELIDTGQPLTMSRRRLIQFHGSIDADVLLAGSARPGARVYRRT